jgi:hypothetical protein
MADKKAKPSSGEGVNEPDEFSKEFNPPAQPKLPIWPTDDTPDHESISGVISDVDPEGGQAERGVLTILRDDNGSSSMAAEERKTLFFLNKSGADRIKAVMEAGGFVEMTQLVNRRIGIRFEGYVKTRAGFRARTFLIGLQTPTPKAPEESVLK